MSRFNGALRCPARLPESAAMTYTSSSPETAGGFCTATLWRLILSFRWLCIPWIIFSFFLETLICCKFIEPDLFLPRDPSSRILSLRHWRKRYDPQLPRLDDHGYFD